MAPHQDIVSLLAQPAPAHMAAMAAQKVVPGKDQVQNVPPSASCRIHGHRRVSSGGQSGHQRMSSQGSIGSPRHSYEEVQHRPAKMTPVIPVTTEITKQISEQHKMAEQLKKAGAPMIQRVPPQQHPPRMQLNTSLTSRDMGSMELPPPPPDMMAAHSSALANNQSEFPPPPPSMETVSQFPEQSQTQDQCQTPSSSQPSSNRSSTSSAGLGMSPSCNQSPRHSINQSPRHSITRSTIPTPVATPVAPSPPPPPLPPPTLNTIQPLHSPQHPQGQMTMSMPGPPLGAIPAPPGTSGVQHRRSSSGPSTPTHGGAKKPPPPPPRRSTTKLSVYGDSAGNKHFMADLQRVLNLKQDRSEQFMHSNPAPDFPPVPPPYSSIILQQVSSPARTEGRDDFADLPPPPEELLEGLPGHEKRRPPPPPPKRNLQTQLSFSRGQIS